MNAASYWYAHSSQWKYERLSVGAILSLLADREKWKGALIDFNVRAERMGWLPSSPQFDRTAGFRRSRGVMVDVDGRYGLHCST